MYIHCRKFNAEFNKLIKTIGHLAGPYQHGDICLSAGEMLAPSLSDMCRTYTSVFSVDAVVDILSSILQSPVIRVLSALIKYLIKIAMAWRSSVDNVMFATLADMSLLGCVTLSISGIGFSFFTSTKYSGDDTGLLLKLVLGVDELLITPTNGYTWEFSSA